MASLILKHTYCTGQCITSLLAIVRDIIALKCSLLILIQQPNTVVRTIDMQTYNNVKNILGTIMPI